MAPALGWVELAGFGAGALIFAVGVFVVTAKPSSRLHQLFFALAVLDAASTILFYASLLDLDGVTRVYFWGTYWYHYIGFLGLLAAFGILFPKPMSSRALRIATLATIAALALGTLALFVLDHGLFWSPAPTTAIPATFQPAGNLVNIAFMSVVAALVVRLSLGLRREASESHRRQGAYVLGGMALAYLPYASTVVAQDVASGGIAPFLSGRWDRVLAHWAFLLAVMALVASGALLTRERRAEARDERNFVLGCYAAVLLFGAIGFVLPSAMIGVALRTLALLAYPVLLGFAIVRYEVFDIDKKLRRAATVTLAATGLTVAFVLAESMLENALASSVLAGIPSQTVSGAVAAVVTAFAFIPIARASRKAASKLVPELSQDELSRRKREIYLHSLSGAMADGILKEGESRTLAMLRESLGISDAEHKALLSQVDTA